MKVLVVSSDERKRASVRASLEGAWTIREAGDGNEALHMVRAAAAASGKAKGAEGAAAEPFVLVVADESTQPFGAFGLSRELKNLPEPPRVLILLDRAQDTWLANWSGADRWMTRPIDPFMVRSAAEDLAAMGLGSEPADLVLGDPDTHVRESAVEQEAADVHGDA